MKRSEHLEPLSHDHYEGLQVARRLRTGLAKSAPPEEMAAYVVHFWDTYLTEHFRQEETLLVPALEAVDGAGLAEQMVSEHHALASRVDALRARTAVTETIDEFAQLLKAHIRFEERRAFPYLEQHLDDAALQRVGTRLHADHVDADLSWRVSFWE